MEGEVEAEGKREEKRKNYYEMNFKLSKLFILIKVTPPVCL